MGKLFIESILCPACGAPLELNDLEAIVTCIYCGAPSKVMMHLRRLEPKLPEAEPPLSPGDPSKSYENWGTAQLVHGILGENERQEKILMAKALDEWPHANDEMALWVPKIVELMLVADPELDMALAGILGKLICSDKMELRQQVIRAGEKYGFTVNGSRGLLFALSLGDAGTVKLLLDIADWATGQGDIDYADKAFLGAQTAIGRERERFKICMEILIHRFFYVSIVVQKWIVKYLKNHFDVGYTFMHPWILELIDDCSIKCSEHVPELQLVMRKCRPADNREELRQRLTAFQAILSLPGRISACESLGNPPADTEEEDVELALQIVAPLLKEPGEVAAAADEALAKFTWVGESIPPPIKDFFENSDICRKIPPAAMKNAYDLRKS